MDKKRIIKNMAAPVCLAILLLAISLPVGSQETAEGLYEAALLKKEATGDLQGAIQLFQRILKQFPEKRDIAAKAQFQIGACYEKLGTAEAVKAYELVLKNYADQPDLVAAARERILAIRQGTPSGLLEAPIPEVEGELSPYSLSPDGTKLLCLDETTGTNISYLDITSGKVVPLTDFDWSRGSLQTGAPVWSPDGSEIAYERYPNDPKVRRHELILHRIGGNPRVLFSTEDGQVTPCDWLKDGPTLVVVWKPQDKPASLGLLPLSGGPFKSVFVFPKDMPVPHPTASPDGRFAVFHEGSANSRNIRTISLTDSSSSLLVDHPADDKDPTWSPDGKVVAFLSTRLGSWALWGLPVRDGRAAGQPFMIKDGMSDTRLLNWRPAGLACAKWMQSDDIFLQSIDPRTNRLVGKPELLSFAPTGQNYAPRWSPDGKSLAFISSARGYSEEARVAVWRREDGKTQEYPAPVPRASSFFDYLNWLPDGSGLTLALGRAASEEGPATLYRLDLASGKWTSFSLPGFFFDYARDGRSLLYGVESHTADPGIVERDLGTGEEKYIFRLETSGNDAVQGLRFSKDFGRLVFWTWTFSKANGDLHVIRTFDVGSGAIRTVYSGPEAAYSPSWSPDGRSLLVYCCDESGWQKDVALIPAEGGPLQRLHIDMNWPSGSGLYGRFTSLDWSPDGTQIALSVWSSIAKDYILKNIIPAAEKK